MLRWSLSGSRPRRMIFLVRHLAGVAGDLDGRAENASFGSRLPLDRFLPAWKGDRPKGPMTFRGTRTGFVAVRLSAYYLDMGIVCFGGASCFSPIRPVMFFVSLRCARRTWWKPRI